tara:strand:- start:1705 stop:1947 length:243 start_codon:yes stop_codon:yes gene_type:complete
MKKLNIIYRIAVVLMIGYLGIENYSLKKRVREAQENAFMGLMMNNQTSIKLDMFMHMMDTDFENEVEAVLNKILKNDGEK